MKLDQSIAQLSDGFRHFGQLFISHSRSMFFLLFVGVLAGAMVSLNLILTMSDDEAYRTKKLGETQSAAFDKKTIDQVNALNAREQTDVDTFPSGRISPFSE